MGSKSSKPKEGVDTKKDDREQNNENPADSTTSIGENIKIVQHVAKTVEIISGKIDVCFEPDEEKRRNLLLRDELKKAIESTKIIKRACQEDKKSQGEVGYDAVKRIVAVTKTIVEKVLKLRYRRLKITDPQITEEKAAEIVESGMYFKFIASALMGQEEALLDLLSPGPPGKGDNNYDELSEVVKNSQALSELLASWEAISDKPGT
mmetsp:Transcript_33443/g.81171  ORF Transcript_33443/g.81171 Transcript_33443/m.81171 type:complete len:207 (-) Transcript_33443:116-736(-)